jgi:RNA polymerase sigma-70 factor (ECF subfamily)
VANETRNLTRSRRRREALALRLGTAEPGGTAAGGPVDEVLAAERRARLVAAVNALPDRESVKSRTSRALSRLRGLLVPGEQDRVSSG